VATYGYHAMVIPICQLGGIPVFCDILESTLTLDTDELERLITKKTKAILVHQPWGNVSNVSRLIDIKRKYNLHLISDSSHAHGAQWNNLPLGKYYDVVCASFGKNKLISGGELGVATMNSTLIRDRMLLYSHVNRVPGALKGKEYKYLNNAVGIKYRPHPFAMAMAIEQIKTFSERIKKVVTNVSHFKNELSDLRNIEFLGSFDSAARVYWKVIAVVGDASDRLSIMRLLLENNVTIENNHYDPLLHENNIFTRYYGIKSKRSFPVASKLKDRIFQLPAYILYGDDELKRIISIFREIDVKV
jgi:perosamine synthetase